jgi:hypothetical protein
MLYHNSIDQIAKELIAQNYGKKGYWKQSLVCLIAAKGYYCMTAAWKILKRFISDFECISVDTKCWTPKNHNAVMKLITSK